ncbi:hypothetical protein BHE74_00025395, partial [Ensete ventricosum]
MSVCRSMDLESKPEGGEARKQRRKVGASRPPYTKYIYSPEWSFLFIIQEGIRERLIIPLPPAGTSLKKLQMRVETPGEALASNTRERAEKSFCFDTNSSCGSLEATRAQLMDFDLALSGLMEDVSWVCEEKHSELREVRTQDNIKRSNSSGCQLYQEDREEADDSSLLLLDLNVEGTSEEMV